MEIRLLRVLRLIAIFLMTVWACSPAAQPEEKPSTDVPTLSISGAQDSFVNGTAYVSLTLSTTTATDVVISLSASGNIDSKLLSFSNPVTIKAGTLSTAVVLTVNSQGLAPGEYTVTIKVDGAAGAKVQGSASVSFKLNVRKAIAEVTLSGPERFSDGRATLSLTPDVPPLNDITVYLEVRKDGASEGKALISPGAITCPEAVVLPANKAEATSFEIKLDLSQLKPVESEAIIAIDDISAGGSIGEPNLVRIGALGELNPYLRSDWNISYSGDYPNPDYYGYMQSVMSVTGFNPAIDVGYYIRYSETGFVQKKYGSLPDFIKAKEKEIVEGIEEGDPYRFYTENLVRVTRLPVGAYDFYMLGCDAEGHLTGDYAMCTVTRTPTEKMRYIYDLWLGRWEVNGEIWTITPQVENSSYYIQGICGVSQGFTAYLGWDGELEIRGEQFIDISENDWYGLYGISGNYYYHHSGPVVYGVMDEFSESAQWTGALNPTTGAPFEAFCIYHYAPNQWLEPWSVPEFMSLEHEGKVSDEAPGFGRYARYSAFLGDWTYNGMRLRFSFKASNESYTVVDLDSEEEYALEVGYDAQTGRAFVADQIVGDLGSDYYMAFSGYYYDSAKSKLYPRFPYYKRQTGDVACYLYMLKDGTVVWDGVGFDGYYISELGAVLFAYISGTTSIYGWANAGEQIPLNTDSMYRPGSTGYSAPAKKAFRAGIGYPLGQGCPQRRVSD